MPRKSTKKPPSAVTASLPASGDSLREHLQKVYATRPKTSKYTGPKHAFRIADHDSGDTWEWRISLGVLDTNPPVLVLALFAIPENEALHSFVHGLGGTVSPAKNIANLLIPFRLNDTTSLRQLAGRIGAVKSVKWPWLTAKVADALVRLAKHLDQYRPPAPIPVMPTP